MDWRKFSQVEFSITTYCQASCPTCARTDMETLQKVSWLKLQHLPFETYVKFLSSIDKTKIKKIQICGDYGDPMMHPRIEDIIKVSAETVDLISIHTNGGLRNPEWFSKIAKLYGNKVVMVFGIDGIDEETNSKYRIGVNFNRAMENMIAYKTNGGHVFWDFLIFSFNEDQIKQAHEIAKKHNMEIYFNINTRDYKDIRLTDPTKILKIKKDIEKYNILVKGNKND